jgi:hypothetical protein
MITLNKRGDQDQPQLPDGSLRSTLQEFDAANNSFGQGPNPLPSDDAIPSEETPSGAIGLLISRVLAMMALCIGGYTLFHPGSETYIGSGILVVCLFVTDHLVQKSEQEKALFASQNGKSVRLPSNSAIWSLALPLLMSLTLIFAVAHLHDSLDSASLTRWLLLSAVSLICPLVINLGMKRAEKHPRLLGLLNGATLGSAMAMAGLCATAFIICGVGSFSGYFSYPLLVAAVLPLLVIAHTAYMTKKLLFRVARQRAPAAFLFACIGSAIMCIFGMVPELRPAAVATGERLAADADTGKSQLGYRLLKQLNAAADLERDSQPWSTSQRSLISVLMPFDFEKAQHEYFALTGHTVVYRPGREANDQVGYDANLGNQFIGEPRPGLSLGDSKITGIVDADSLTSSLYWTMTVANDSEQPEEARAQIALPPGAAVSRVTLWINGIEQEAAFNSTQAVQQAYQWIVQRHRDPVLVTETGSGKVFLQAYPVPKWGEMKVRIGITAPLELKSSRQFRIQPPHVVSSNFARENTATDIQLESNASISGNADDQAVTNGKILTGTLKHGASERYQFMITRQSDFANFSVRATHSQEHSFINEQMLIQSRPVHKLAIVVDGSAAVGKRADEICHALAKLQPNLKSEIIIATRNAVQKESFSPQALANLRHFRFEGGCDDTEALLAAKQFIGREKQGAILWLHGQQPFVKDNDASSLQHLMKRGEHRLKVYDYPLEADQPNQIKNYLISLDADACPDFDTVFQTGAVETDLNSFIAETVKTGRRCRIARQKEQGFVSNSIENDPAVASRVSALWAADEARKCNALGDQATANQLGMAYRVVTPVTGAVVLETQSDYDHTGLKREMYSVVSANTHAPAGTADGTSTLINANVTPSPFGGNVSTGTVVPQGQVATLQSALNGTIPPQGSSFIPTLQGTTNGTIGPQGGDVTYVTGVNTAGTVRVNSLANLEALLNLIANGIEIIGVIVGTSLIVRGFAPTEPKLARRQCRQGAIFFLLAIATPAIFNALIALARDANLFS